MEFLAEIHPKIVHFPLAFLLLYPIMELLFFVTRKEFFNKSAFLFLLIGVIGALLAVLSGNQAHDLVSEWNPQSLEIFNTHQTFANISIWYFTTLLTLRFYLHIKKRLNRYSLIIIFILSLLGSYFVYQTGLYGGKLADEHVLKTTLSFEIKK
jgi:uncharacterized membrane protein